MGRYAEKTTVSSDKSRAETESTLRRYGAEAFMYGWQEGSAVIGFQFQGRAVKFLLPMPSRESDEIRLTPSGKWLRSDTEQEKAYEQAVRQRWRALALCIKAKLEAVEAGIVSFDEEFLAHFVLPGGGTVGQRWEGEYQKLVEGKELPPLIPM